MKEPDFQKLYEDYEQLDSTRQNLLKRSITPDDLFEIAAFYDLYRPHFKSPHQRAGLMCLIFCLPYVTHKPEGKSLGAALSAIGPDGRPIISEKRVIQLSRIEDRSKAMIQLRRLLKHAQPVLDWCNAARSIWYWGKRSRRQLLEDFFLSLPVKTKEN
jgi:CRISPR system Cascade subunit CasB